MQNKLAKIDANKKIDEIWNEIKNVL